MPVFTDENRRKAKEVIDGYDQVMRWAKKHRVKLGFGTDAASTMVDTVLLELEARSPHFTPYEMLVQATSNNGTLFAMARTRNPYREAPLGVIEVGAWADLLLYDGNPLDDITVTKDVRFVMVAGKVMKHARGGGMH